MDAGYLSLATKYVRRQAKQLAMQLDGVCLAEDVEFIHRARVATRRLRAALRMFPECFPAAAVKQWRRQLRRLAQGLGEARDRDVQIEFLCGALQEVEQPACYPGIARLLVRLERHREGLQGKVVKAVRRLRSSRVTAQMRRVTGLALADPAVDEACPQTAPARRQAGKHLLGRLEKLLPYEASLGDPADQAQHHAMRIAAKRLRYGVEIARPIYGHRLDEVLEALKRLQTLLGEIHDCDVWVEQLDAFTAAEARRVRRRSGSSALLERLKVGIDYLRWDRRKRRVELFEELVAYWEAVRPRWEDLRRATAEGGEQADEAGGQADEAVACPPAAAPSGAVVGPAAGSRSPSQPIAASEPGPAAKRSCGDGHEPPGKPGTEASSRAAAAALCR